MTLVPCARYERVAGETADVVTNFASFGEMTRTSFDSYISSPPFRTARYLFLINRIQSRPTYDTDLTIMDYPIWNPTLRLHFAMSPIFSQVYGYRRRWMVFSERFMNNPYFEYIGKPPYDPNGSRS